MNNHLRDFVKQRSKAGPDALPEREQRVVQHFGDRRQRASRYSFAQHTATLFHYERVE
jgi:hypothetical protein